MEWIKFCFLLISRFLLAIPFLWSGMYHLFNWSGPLSYWLLNPVAVPFWMLLVVILVQIIAAIGIVLGFFTRFFASLLVILLVYVSFVFQGFGFVDQLSFNESVSALAKNSGIIGGLILLIVSGPGRIAFDHKDKKEKVIPQCES